MTQGADPLPLRVLAPLLAQLRRLPQPLQFLGVGGCAAGTHLLGVAALVQGLHWPPLLANVLAFLVAFCVSYAGHALLTFSQHQTPHLQAIPRFFAVACLSFAVNEVLYLVALNVLHLHYFWSLAAVLLIVSVLTFVAAKFWAFARVDA
ncbi:GtrA family protein [Comamonas humi]